MFNVVIACAALLYSANSVLASEFSDSEKAVIQTLSLNSLQPKPQSPSNQFADNEQAQQFGEQLFFDKKLSRDNSLACSSCHSPDKFFTDGLPLSNGSNGSGRNTPTVVGSAWLRWFYWDGRKDSLWSQALIPLEAQNEMASNRLAVVRYIAKNQAYRAKYESIFGLIDSVIVDESLPKSAGPFGNSETQDAWARLSPELRLTINKTFVNVGKALAAYQRTLVYESTRFDEFTKELESAVEQDLSSNNSLNSDELAGLKLFIDPEKTQCMQCHNGPLLTNKGFHNVGTGSLRVEPGKQLDFGRMIGLQAVVQDEFNCFGIYSDAQEKECHSLRFMNKSAHMPIQGAFKTPSLRKLSQTAPYFHDGRFSTLEEVVRFYNNPPTTGAHELLPLNLTDIEISQLVSFLKSLSQESE